MEQENFYCFPTLNDFFAEKTWTWRSVGSDSVDQLRNLCENMMKYFQN
jgi:hypothetical protein